MENEKNYVDGKLMIVDENDRTLSEAERQKKLMERKQQSSYDRSEFQQNQHQCKIIHILQEHIQRILLIPTNMNQHQSII